MGRRRRYEFIDSDMLDFIKTWDEAKEVAYSYLNAVVEEAEKLNNAQRSRNRLESESEGFIRNRFFLRLEALCLDIQPE